MNWRKILGTVALGATLLIPALIRAEDPLLAVGPIQKVDQDGRLWVSGQAYVVTDDTQIVDLINRPVNASELVAGVAVEITYENTQRGATAKIVVATLMR